MRNKRSIIYILLFLLAGGSIFFVSHKFSLAASDATVNVTAKISVCGNDIKEGGEHCDRSQLGGKSCSDLGYASGSLICTFACEFNSASCTTSAETTAIPLFTSSIGGDYTITNSNNAATVSLPQNFYTQDLRLQMFSYAQSAFQSTKPPPSGKSFVGKTYDFVFINPDGDVVATISQPATIVLTYSQSDVSGIDESTLAPYRRGSGDTSWQLIPGSTVNTINNTVTFSTTTFSSFAIFGTLSSSSPSGGGSGGSGGGGGSGYTPPPSQTSVIFSGRAYPKSTVTILKDAQVAVTTVADSAANFQTTLSNLTGGNYFFSVYSEDNKGNRSSLLTFPISITVGATTTVSGIFIAPSIATDKSEVKRGDYIAIFGQSAPQADIIIAVSSEEEFFVKIVTDKEGIYLHNFDTAVLDYGQHFAKAKASVGNLEISSYSKTRGFIVSTKTVLAESSKIGIKGDLNGDGKVNLIDFSIAAYWYKRVLSVDFIAIEGKVLNDDGRIDLVDFSIMAYYWTG